MHFPHHKTFPEADNMVIILIWLHLCLLVCSFSSFLPLLVHCYISWSVTATKCQQQECACPPAAHTCTIQMKQGLTHLNIINCSIVPLPVKNSILPLTKPGWKRILCLFLLHELLHDMNAGDGRHHDDETDREHGHLHLAHRHTSGDTLWTWTTTKQLVSFQN